MGSHLPRWYADTMSGKYHCRKPEIVSAPSDLVVNDSESTKQRLTFFCARASAFLIGLCAARPLLQRAERRPAPTVPAPGGRCGGRGCCEARPRGEVNPKREGRFVCVSHKLVHESLRFAKLLAAF